jgi:Transglycosylase SLT domain
MICRRSFLLATPSLMISIEGWALNSFNLAQVGFAAYRGGGTLKSWANEACAAASVPYNKYWLLGFWTLCLRESSDNPNSVNTSDRNATGPIVSDGHKLGCSRGIAQCIPQTFASYHANGTSEQIYDPVANIAAAIKYVRSRYNVSESGSNLATAVQQADPGRHPHPYLAISWVDSQRRQLGVP